MLNTYLALKNLPVSWTEGWVDGQTCVTWLRLSRLINVFCHVWTQQRRPSDPFRSRKYSLRNQDLHNGADSSTVTLPHAPEPRLTADIPQLQTQRVQFINAGSGHNHISQWFLSHCDNVTLNNIDIIIYKTLKKTQKNIKCVCKARLLWFKAPEAPRSQTDLRRWHLNFFRWKSSCGCEAKGVSLHLVCSGCR